MDINFSGKHVPRVGLGCMGMSEFYGATNDDVGLDSLVKAFDLGYRHFDTADMYGRGHNEELVGKFLKALGGGRSEVVLSTKAGIVRNPTNKYSVSVNTSKRYLKEACETSLRRLGQEHIDLYYLHRVSSDTPIEESMDAMSELISEGKIGSVGLCEVDAETLNKAHAILPLSALQSEYSLWSREVEQEILPTCERLGITFVAFSPLGRGFLTGTVSAEMISAANPDEDFRTQLPRFQQGNIEANLALAAALRQLALELQCSPAVLALAWLLKQSPSVVPIPGTKTPKYLKENFGALHYQIGDAVMNSLNDIFHIGVAKGGRYPAKPVPAPASEAT